MLLADLGAEVIKIEDPQGCHPTRRLGPPFVKGENGYFTGVNRNKRRVALDLRKAQGCQVLYDLVKVSDVVFSDFRPGTMERLDCDYETLKEIDPQIIYCSLRGFSETDPIWRSPRLRPGHRGRQRGDDHYGEPGRPPGRMGIPMGDLSGSLFCAFA